MPFYNKIYFHLLKNKQIILIIYAKCYNDYIIKRMFKVIQLGLILTN